MLHFFTLNNCSQGESTSNFNNQNRYVLNNRVNLETCFQNPLLRIGFS